MSVSTAPTSVSSSTWALTRIVYVVAPAGIVPTFQTNVVCPAAGVSVETVPGVGLALR